MIDRYSITASPDKLRERFAVDVPDFYTPRFNASPTQILPVITNTSPQGISAFYWGETPGWAKNKAPGEKLINIRNETISEKAALKKAMMKTRCLIPADGFYAWKRVGKKTNIPYRFVLNKNEIFSFPGLWEEYEDENGEEMHTFSIFTTNATGSVAEVQERMPVIFKNTDEQKWLSGEATESELLELLSKNNNEKLDYYPVSPRINDVTLDVPSLITPTAPADQFGNLTLFD